jgi:hypothetical protein
MAIFTASQTQAAVLPGSTADAKLLGSTAQLQQPDDVPPYRASGSAFASFSGNGALNFSARTIATAVAPFAGSGAVVGAHFDIDTTTALFTGSGAESAAVATFNYENFGDQFSSGTLAAVAVNGANFQIVTQGSGSLTVVAHT